MDFTLNFSSKRTVFEEKTKKIVHLKALNPIDKMSLPSAAVYLNTWNGFNHFSQAYKR
jgi:hypothetical protein